jgi:hypothetical protein
MGAWRVAAEASSSSAATPSASCLSTHPSRCCAGTYSLVTGATAATVCIPCGAGESRMHVVSCPLTPSSLCAYCGLLKYIYLYSCFSRTVLVLFLLCVCVCAGLLASSSVWRKVRG